MLTALQRDRRTRRDARFNLESLDDRIVLSAAAAGAAAEVAGTRAALLEQRHEAKLARAEARQEAKLARAEEKSPVLPIVVGASGTTAGTMPASASTAAAVSTVPATTVSGENPASTDATPAVAATIPVIAPAPTAPTTGSTTSSTLTTSVAAALRSLYAEYESQGGGSTFTPSEPNDTLLRISGVSVEVNIKVSPSASFNTVLSQLDSDGLQVGASSSTYGLIDGMLPIADLAAVARLNGAGSVTSTAPPLMN